jgi:hypothetical protein
MSASTEMTTGLAGDHPRGVKPIRVDPNWVTIQMEGFGWREFMVRLPAAAVFGDVVDPAIWALVQASRTVSLKRHDRLYLVAHDEEWACECRVIAASSTGATVSVRGGRIELTARSTEALPEDELYRIVWAGNGHEVRRKSDGQQMAGYPFNSLAAAVRHMESLHPRPAA